MLLCLKVKEPDMVDDVPVDIRTRPLYTYKLIKLYLNEIFVKLTLPNFFF